MLYSPRNASSDLLASLVVDQSQNDMTPPEPHKCTHAAHFHENEEEGVHDDDDADVSNGTVHDKRYTWGTTQVGSLFFQYRPETAASILNPNIDRIGFISNLYIGKFYNDPWWRTAPARLRAYDSYQDGVANEGQPGGGGVNWAFMSIAYDLNPNVAPMSTRYHSEPVVWLHESAHTAAYHYMNNYNALPNEYNQAMAEGLYAGNCVRRGYGTNTWYGDNYYLGPCYSATNGHEYFAEATEGYFFVNDYFPFNNQHLRRLDPRAWVAVGNWWGNPNLTLRSRFSTKPITIKFFNNCPFAVQINWYNGGGGEQALLGSLAANAETTFQTWETHAFNLRHGSFAGGLQYEVQSIVARDFNMNVKVCDRRDYSGCTDSNAYCPSWAQGGECAKNPGYMLYNCRKSCNTCYLHNNYVATLMQY